MHISGKFWGLASAVLLACLIGGCCRHVTANLNVGVDEKSSKNAKLIFIFTKDEKKYNELIKKSAVELNAYSESTVLTETHPEDFEIRGAQARLLYNAEDPIMRAAVYNFSYYRDPHDVDQKVIVGNQKNISFEFCIDGDYQWGVVCYWAGVEEHNAVEEVPPNAYGMNIVCIEDKKAKFEVLKD